MNRKEQFTRSHRVVRDSKCVNAGLADVRSEPGDEQGTGFVGTSTVSDDIDEGLVQLVERGVVGSGRGGASNVENALFVHGFQHEMIANVSKGGGDLRPIGRELAPHIVRELISK